MSNPDTRMFTSYGSLHSSDLYISSLIDKPLPPKIIQTKIKLEMELLDLKLKRKVINPILELEI